MYTELQDGVLLYGKRNCVTGLLCCTAEIEETFSINYTLIKNKKEYSKKKKELQDESTNHLYIHLLVLYCVIDRSILGTVCKEQGETMPLVNVRNECLKLGAHA